MRRIEKGDWVYLTSPGRDKLEKIPPYTLLKVVESENKDCRFSIDLSKHIPERFSHTCISDRHPVDKDYYLHSRQRWEIFNFEEALKNILE